MKLELMMKVIDREIDDEEKAAQLAKRLINGAEEEDLLKFTYKPYTIDLQDVGTFGLEDDEHTKIMMPFGMFYAKINYNVFCTIYEASLFCKIKTVNDFKITRR